MLETFILSNYQCDIFIDTCDYQLAEERKELDRAASFRYKDEGTLEEYRALYKPRLFNAQPYTAFFEEKYDSIAKELCATQREDNFLKRYVAMLYKIRSAQNIANNYANLFGAKYDYYIRTRSDLSYKNYLTLELLQTVKDGHMLIDAYGNGRNSCGDVFAVGTKKDMETYCNLIYNLYAYKQKGVEMNTEVLLPLHLRAHKIEWTAVQLVDNVIRPTEWHK